MSRLAETFNQLKKQNRKALITYVTAGYPSLQGMTPLVKALEKGGADIVEIGVPFSDPIADGPTIQFSSCQALKKGITLSAVLKWVKTFRKSSQIPIVLMSYLNPIHHMRFLDFAKAASEAGVDGLIVPDMIPEESVPLRKILSAYGIDLIFLVAPTTPDNRKKWLAEQSQGFLYAVSLTGVTGARQKLPMGVMPFLKKLKQVSPVPVAVGFGISSPEQARMFSRHVDGVIVGSALINRIKKKKPIRPFIQSLRRSLGKALSIQSKIKNLKSKI